MRSPIRIVTIAAALVTIVAGACTGSPISRAAGEEVGGGSLAEERREAADITRARIEAFDAARTAGRLGRIGSFKPIPNPGWTTERPWNLNQDDWEPAIAADPSAPFVYMLTTRYTGPPRCPACRGASIVLRVSSDGGRTFGPDRFLCACKGSEGGQYDPQIVTDAGGTVYAVWLQGFQPGVTFSKSTDKGLTWSAPVSMPTTWSDKPWLAVSPSGQDVYIAYNGPSHGDSFVGVSHDGGATFVAKKVTDGNRYFFAGGSWVSDDGRQIVFAESDYDQRNAGRINSDVVVSSDAGASWRVVRVATGARQPDCTSQGCYDGFYGPTPTIAGDGETLLFVYAANDADRAPQRVFATSSADGGATWSAPVPLSPAGVNGLFPAAVSGKAGDLRVWWMDQRTGRWNVWYSSSTDGGATWTPEVRLSNARGGASYKRPKGFLEAYGDYGEIAVTNTGKTVAVWGEGASFAGPGGVWFVRQR